MQDYKHLMQKENNDVRSRNKIKPLFYLLTLLAGVSLSTSIDYDKLALGLTKYQPDKTLHDEIIYKNHNMPWTWKTIENNPGKSTVWSYASEISDNLDMSKEEVTVAILYANRQLFEGKNHKPFDERKLRKGDKIIVPDPKE
jgi:hypothetical protein